MSDEQRQRRVTRTALVLGVVAVLVYVGYIAMFVLTGDSGASGG